MSLEFWCSCVDTYTSSHNFCIEVSFSHTFLCNTTFLLLLANPIILLLSSDDDQDSVHDFLPLNYPKKNNSRTRLRENLFPRKGWERMKHMREEYVRKKYNGLTHKHTHCLLHNKNVIDYTKELYKHCIHNQKNGWSSRQQNSKHTER